MSDKPDLSSPSTPTAKPERIAKLLARAGVGSRRAVERMIEAGMVRLNGKLVTTPATLVTSVQGITVDGEKVREPEPPRLWKYHKPAGRVTSYFDPEERPTIFQALPEHMPRVISVGRLDINTEGLLLLTNDGELSRWMELPDTGWLRQYKVRAHGRPNQKRLEEIRAGVTIDGVVYREVDIEIPEQAETSNIWLTIGLREGKNREVRKLLEYAGLKVTRLIRLRYGPFDLGRMTRGQVVEIPEAELKLKCREFFETRGIEIPEEPQREKPKPKAGWARPKPKAHPRRQGKRRAALSAKPESLPKSPKKSGAKYTTESGVSRARPAKPKTVGGAKASGTKK